MEIHKKFVQLGRKRNRITYQLLALLPEIYKSEIYRGHGCATIYEYAGKFAGLSHGVVEKALKLDRKLEDKPCLQKAIETQGVHKVAIVANIATKETDEMWADKVENMSKSSLAELRREVRGDVKPKVTIELDDEMEFMLLKFKKESGIQNNKEALRTLLRKTTQQKGGVVAKCPGTKRDKPSKTLSRYIPAKQRRQLSEKCSHPGCNRPSEVIHHRDRFSTSKSHDSITPLCKIHHEFAHNGITEPLQLADLLYRKYRQASLL